MGIPSRARFQHQGPATNCTVVKNGVTYHLGWLSCTCYAGAMGVDKSTLGAKNPTGCAVRTYTGDVSGGTTLEQVRTYCEAVHVPVELHTGNNVSSAYYLAVQLQAGRGAVVQGDAGAMVGTTHRSTGGAVSHAVWVNDVRGGTLGHPNEAFVYDPAADGRATSWGHAAQGPQWWPWGLVLKFASMLRPAGPGTPMIGANRIYCLIFADTEPHVHLRYGAARTSPFPDHLKGKSGTSLVARRIRPGPGTQYAPLGVLAPGEDFVAYQWVNGPAVDGHTRWYGNHGDGTGRWVSAAGITGEGGS